MAMNAKTEVRKGEGLVRGRGRRGAIRGTRIGEIGRDHGAGRDGEAREIEDV